MRAEGQRFRPPVRRENESPSVVHLIETLGSGGAERLLYTNLKHLPEGMSHTVVTVFARGEERWAEPIRRLGVNVESLDCRGYRDIHLGVRRFRARLRREKVDLLHTHLWAANVIGRVAGRLSGVPVISSVHNPDYEPEAWADGSQVSTAKRKLIRAADRWTAHFGCRRMIAVSEYARQSAHRQLRFPLGRIDLLYNPIDSDELRAAPQTDRGALRRELRMPDGAPVLIHVGRVSPQKGLLFAVRALASIREGYPQVHLVSAGATDDQVWHARLRQEAERAGVADRVHFLGARRDIPDILRAGDVFVFPSLHEGLGIALVEAMAVGSACVASATGPIPEVIRHGENGWLVPPGDANALAGAVSKLLGDEALRRALGERARAHALELFEPRRAAQKLNEIYQAVLQNS